MPKKADDASHSKKVTAKSTSNIDEELDAFLRKILAGDAYEKSPDVEVHDRDALLSALAAEQSKSKLETQTILSPHEEIIRNIFSELANDLDDPLNEEKPDLTATKSPSAAGATPDTKPVKSETVAAADAHSSFLAISKELNEARNAPGANDGHGAIANFYIQNKDRIDSTISTLEKGGNKNEANRLKATFIPGSDNKLHAHKAPRQPASTPAKPEDLKAAQKTVSNAKWDKNTRAVDETTKTTPGRPKK